METEELLTKFESTIKEGFNLPLVKSKVVIDVFEAHRFLREIRASLPEEVDQARAIANDRIQIIKKANREAEAIVRSAKDQAKRLIDKSEIVIKARARARATEKESKKQAKAFQVAAQNYIFKLFEKTEEALNLNMNEFNKISRKIKSLHKQNQS